MVQIGDVGLATIQKKCLPPQTHFRQITVYVESYAKLRYFGSILFLVELQGSVHT